MKTALHCLFCTAILLAAPRIEASPRVALMDFSVDDNSYRSAQTAADLTAILQARLAGEPGVEWVERSQLDKARQELELSAMELMNGGSAIPRGKWVKADWMVTGQFSLDDRNRRTLFLEITDLQHADVIAGRTITFSNETARPFQATTNQADVAAGALHQLLSEARLRQAQTADKILVAPLFLAQSAGALEQGFEDALERTVATNGRVGLIRFPKAYRSLEESEMVLDGLVEVDRNAWQQTADLYVWGTCALTNQMIQGAPPEQKLEITAHLWDGVSLPEVVKEELPSSFIGRFSAGQAAVALNRLATRVVARAHKSKTSIDSASIRKEISKSLVETYDQMTLRGGPRQELGLDDPEKFFQAVHILETACFFDPDNANARVLYITCRWGWWMDFTFKVKNQFWSKWRRSRAWGKYVERFGLKPATVALPFPYQQQGDIPAVYVRSLEDVAKMFPQWHSAEEMALEEQWQRQGVHTWLMEAEFHGFPKEMPHDLAMKWKTEVEAEQWKRLTKVAQFIAADWTAQGKSPPMILSTVFRQILHAAKPAAARLDLLEKIWPACAKAAQTWGQQWIVGAGQLAADQERALVDLCAEAGVPEKGKQLLAMLSPNQPSPTTPSLTTETNAVKTTSRTSSPMVATPAWLKEIQPNFSMFRLFPPEVLPLKAQPTVQEFRFPSQFDVRTVDQMAFLQDKLLILAMDKRSAPSSDANPDVSAETLAKRGRLWILEPGAACPVLFQPQLLPETVHSFFLQDNRLWIAGRATGYLDLKTQTFRKFAVSDGFGLQKAGAVGFAGGTIFAAGDFFRVCQFDAATGHWTDLPKPTGTLSSRGDAPRLLTGNRRWLIYTAGSVAICDVAKGVWTNLLGLPSFQCALSDDSGFWLGGRDGLHFLDPARKSSRDWTAPQVIQGMMNPLMGFPFTGNSMILRSSLEQLDGQIRGSIKRLEKARAQSHAAKLGETDAVNPMHLDWRLPGAVTAVANDGDFLWLGAGNYFGNYLLLLHKPSESLVAYGQLNGRDAISSLVVSKTSVWLGLAYGQHQLLQFSKDSFLSVPQSRWLSLAISTEERQQLVRRMSTRDQAMYAFYAGDDARVAGLLGDADPDKASLENMFLLAFSHDSLGLDRPEQARFWFERIISRYPDSPWAKAAQAALSDNEVNHKTKTHETSRLEK